MLGRLGSMLATTPAVEALRDVDYRRYWLAAGLGGFGLNFWFLAAAWLVLDLTDSPLMVGLVNGLAAAPSIVLSLFGGALTDRVDRRRMLIGALASWSVLAAVTGALGVSGVIEWWHVLLVAAGIGVADAASNPAWHTGGEHGRQGRLLAANALAQPGEFGGSSMVAGLFIASMGPSPTFFVAAGVALGVVLMRMVAPPAASAAEPDVEGPAACSPTVGWAGIRCGHGRSGLLALSATSLLSAAVFPLIPVYARDVLEVGARGYGVMAAAVAGGMMLGAVAMTLVGEVRRPALVIVAARLVWFVAMAGFALSGSLVPSLALLVLMGASGAVSGNLILTQFQVHAESGCAAW
jgi:MFS family permease